MGFGSFFKGVVKGITKATGKITGLSAVAELLQVKKPAQQEQEQASNTNNTTAQSVIEEETVDEVTRKKKLAVSGKSGLTVKRPNITGSLSVGGGSSNSGGLSK